MHGVLPAASIIRMDNSRLCFHWPYVLTFAAVYGNRLLDSAELRKVALEKVFIVTSGCRDTAPAGYLIGLEEYPASTGSDWCRLIDDCDLFLQSS